MMPEGATVQQDALPKQPDTVRVATPRDEMPLYQLLLALERDNGLGVPRSDEKVWRHVAAACSGREGLAGVVEIDDRIVGSVGIFAAQPWYSDAWYLSMHWLFVRPEYRTRVEADDLFRFALWHRADMSRRLGTEVGLEMTVMNKRLELKERLWRRYATKIGAIFFVGHPA